MKELEKLSIFVNWGHYFPESLEASFRNIYTNINNKGAFSRKTWNESMDAWLEMQARMHTGR